MYMSPYDIKYVAILLYHHKETFSIRCLLIERLNILRRSIFFSNINQKMFSYLNQSSTAENGDIYQIYFYRYILIGRKMSPYGSENVLLFGSIINCRKRGHILQKKGTYIKYTSIVISL